MLIRQTKRENVPRPNKDLICLPTNLHSLCLFTSIGFIFLIRGLYIIFLYYYGAFILHRFGPID